MKKCLCCNNLIEKLDHYVCKECYKDIKQNLKKNYTKLNEKELKNDYRRWNRNLILTKDPIYKSHYQKILIAIAEVYNEKYNDETYIRKIIDFSNNQKQIEKVIIKKSEEETEKVANENNKDEDVILKDYSSYKVCDDGHRVISKSELLIDNLLTKLGLRHSYDIEIDNDTDFRYDFKLLDYDHVYIEHWGYTEKKEYEERKIIKKEYYKSKKYTLIESEESTVSNRKHIIKQLREKVPGIKMKEID